MAYTTTNEFIQEFGLRETAQLLESDEDRISEDNLKAWLDDTVAGGFDDCEALERANQRLDGMIIQAANYMNGYIAKRYPLPLSDEQIAGTSLKTCNLELTRCQLMEDADNGTEQQEKRCKRWHHWLRDIASGKVEIITTQAASTESKIYQGQSNSNYDWSTYP